MLRVNGDAPRHAGDVCIIGVARTPCGSLQGKLSALKNSDLAGIAVKGVGNLPRRGEARRRGGARPGPRDLRRSRPSAGLPQSVVCSSVNKVCASGMKAVMLGAQLILLGLRGVVVVGVMESMSQAPHLSKKARDMAISCSLMHSRR
ncbi:erg10, acetyl-CoA C-acetyltransferase [Phytophthora pseudosyringae]|uniref:Erg10, acetyl-CoA C-acetyltransferase n=1 Tax=Phytophthora pseudosyringae TaxID=221518 RepID=A0A8T1WKZ2_9STRA|nr:erg10, acetyl-CoA C-acetyltransferase [Phytophthora pseudosyringae]